MSRYIEVNHLKLEQAASDIDEYISEHNRYMDEAHEKVQNMKQFYDGDDYIQYYDQWLTLTNEESTSKNITKSMKNYSDFLRHSAAKYKEAQINAVNRSNSISIW